MILHKILRKVKSVIFILLYKAILIAKIQRDTLKNIVVNFKNFFKYYPEKATANFVAGSLSSYVNLNIGNIRGDISGYKNKRIAFIPYQSPDCIIQHALVAKVLNTYGCDTQIITPSVPDIIKNNIEFSAKSFDELIENLINSFGKDHIFSRGVLDDFIRTCELSVFTGNFVINASFLNQMHNTNDYAKSLIQPHDAVVLADTAYSLNRAIRSNCHYRDTPLFALNPHGQWRQVTPLEDENFSLIRFGQILKNLEEGDDSQYLDAVSYLAKRFSGKSQSDLDSSKIFSKKVVEKALNVKSPKKILFLHSFRDASGLSFPDDPNELFFPTYFQWTEAAFALISKHQEDWIIKPHPSQGHYPNDNEILEFLLNKYSINRTIVIRDFPTITALLHKWPIYTCSGTIAQEAACFGFKAHTVSGRIPDQISCRPKTYQEFKEAYTKPIGLASEVIENDILIKAAKIFFAEQYSGSQLFARNISPKNPVLPSLSPLNIYWQKCRVLFQMSLICKSKSGCETANKLATTILGQLRSSK
jgi:hypothetical protein